MAEFEKFIHDLAFQLNLSLMDDAQRARLADYKKKNTATKDQNTWDPKAALPDPTSPEYDISTIDDWQKLYEGFQNVLYSLNSERKGATRYHEDVEKFLDKFYGVGKCIAPFEVSSDITSILTPAHATAFAAYLNTIRAHLEANDIPSASTDKLIKKLNDGSFKTDKKALDILRAVCARIIYDSTALPPPPITLADITTLYEKSGQGRPATTVEISNFQANYTELVKGIITKSEVFNAFSTKDDARLISYSIDQALRQSNYTSPDSKNFLPPLYKDRKRFFDRAKKKINDWEKDYFGRWRSRHERHIYSTNASYIVSEIIDNKIRPIDGLGKILENADKIKSKLAPKAKTEFDYFVKVLNKLSKTKAFAEATKDGDQMRYLVQEIIKDAVHNDKVEEAKTVLETLAMVRYGAMTSSVRDKLKEATEDFTLFGDENLSFNKKNEGLKFVLKGFDKVIKTAGILAFETANLIKNKLIRQKGVKFKNGTKRIKEAMGSIEYADSTKRKKMEELFAFWDFVNSSISKDYKIFRRHSKVQDTMTQKPNGRTTRPIDDMFNDFYTSNSIGR